MKCRDTHIVGLEDSVYYSGNAVLLCGLEVIHYTLTVLDNPKALIMWEITLI